MDDDLNLFATDTTNVQEMGGFEVYPAGKYPAIMITGVKKAAKSNPENKYIECVYQFFTEGSPYKGKKFTSRVHLWNNSPDAVERARREIKSLRVSMGLSDTEANILEFLNKPVILNLSVDYQKQNGEVTDRLQNSLKSIEIFKDDTHTAYGEIGQPLPNPVAVAQPVVPVAVSVKPSPAVAPNSVASASAPAKKPWDKR